MLKDVWTDKVDGVDVNSAEDINQVANATIALEEATVEITVKTNKNAREIEKIKENQTTVEVDSELSEVSENPLQNKVVTSNLKELKAKNSEISLAVLNNENKTKFLQYYGDANIVPSNNGLFEFAINDTTMTASVKAKNTDISGDIVIPYEYVDGDEVYAVTRLDNYAFLGCNLITSVIIPEGITYISESAFRSCDNLKTIILPKSTTGINDDAFDSDLPNIYYNGTPTMWNNVDKGIMGYGIPKGTKVYNSWEETKKIIEEEDSVDTAILTVENNNIYSYSTINEHLSGDFGVVGIGFTAVLIFSTPSAIPNDYSTFPDNIIFKGDSVEDNRFVPERYKRYTIVFDYDGINKIGYVSGVDL